MTGAEGSNPDSAAGPGRDDADSRWKLLVPPLLLCFAFIAADAVLLNQALASEEAPLAEWAVAAALEALLVCVFAFPDRRDLRPLLDPRHVTARGVVLAIGVFVVLAAVMAGYVYYVAERIAIVVELTGPFREQGWPLWAALLILVFAPGVVEEIAFRGYLLNRFERLMKPGDAAILQAFLFSVLHMSLVMLPAFAFFGLALAFLRRRTGSLLPCMAVHMLWNGCVVARGLFAGA